MGDQDRYMPLQPSETGTPQMRVRYVESLLQKHGRPCPLGLIRWTEAVAGSVELAGALECNSAWSRDEQCSSVTRTAPCHAGKERCRQAWRPSQSKSVPSSPHLSEHVISTTTREVLVMKPRTTAATFALAAALGLGLSAPARAQAPDPCSVFLCMSSMTGFGTPSPECAAPIATFHAIQVWSPAFNSPATAAARRVYLTTCPGATAPNQAILEAIIAKWGYRP